MAIQTSSPQGLGGARTSKTAPLGGPKGTAPFGTAPFEELATLRPPSLGLPTTAGLTRLRQAFSAAIDRPGPSTRALFELVAKGAVSPAMVDYVVANRQSIADVRQDAAALRPRLENLATPVWAASNAALDLVATAQTFQDLADTPANRDRAAGFMAEHLARHVAPADKALRPAVKEMLLTGTLTQPTLDQLGPRGAKRVATLLRRQLGLLDMVAGTHMALLRTAVGRSAATLRRAPDATAVQLAAAVRTQLKGRDLERFDATQARAAALIAETHLNAGPARARLSLLGQVLAGRLGGARAALTEAGRADARLKKDLTRLHGLLKAFQKRADTDVRALTRGQLVPKAHLSAFAGQTSGFVAEAQGALGGLQARASASAGLALGRAHAELAGLKQDVDGAVAEVRGVARQTAGGVRQGLVGSDGRTIAGGVSGQAQGQLQLGGKVETTLGKPGEISRTEQVIGRAFDAIPDIDKSFDAKATFGGQASVHAAGGVSGALGSASYEANASAYARGEAYARGGIKKTGESLEANLQAGFKVEAGVSADANFQANLLGGLVQANGQVSAVVRAEAHADVQAQLTVGRDANGRIQLHAQGQLDVGASLEASVKGSANLNLGGMQLAAEGQAGVMVGFRATVGGELGIKDGKVSIGFNCKLSFIFGFNLSGRLSFPIPKFIQNIGQAFGKAKDALKGGLQKAGEAVKSVGKAVAKGIKSIGKVFSKL